MTDVTRSALPTPGKRRNARRFDWRGLRADARATVPDASLALLITGLIFWWLWARIDNGTSPSLQIMPPFEDASEYWWYWLCQAFGWSGLLWAYITVVFGLLRSGTRPPWRWMSAARVEKWHRTTSLTTIGLIFMHMATFFAAELQTNFDNQPTGELVRQTLVKVFVPGGYDTGTGRIAILLGLLAFYLAIILGLAFYVRQTTGSRLWRALHRFIIIVYVLSAWHTLLYGTNVWFEGSFRTLVWALQMPLAGLLLLRLLAPARPSERLRLRGPRREPRPLPLTTRLTGRLAVLATIAGLAAIIITGTDGGRPDHGHSTDPWPEQWVIWTGLLTLTLALVTTIHRLRPTRHTPAHGQTPENNDQTPNQPQPTS
ncbi:iron reductase [Streptomyces sp. 8K308]|uniref:ferric reductase-like transmembrane domain-containing protein n=1 Tax=Streptomyces sp. 8K308 TaxID=2530388 RepID=UPI00104C6CDA|nr:ferric reductase-like transmembrane domain-containing protein [Streptomyces sp. 8K308]TDC27433.1 iron reductase [Streptomyces sp. 8K308]